MRADEFCTLATRALAKKQYDKATQVASKGLDSFPDNADLLVILGQAYLDGECFYEASVILEKALTINRDYPRVWGALAKCYVELGAHDEDCYEKSVKAAKKAIRRGKGDPSGYITLSYVELQRSNYDKAFEYAQKGLKMAPESKAAVFNMSIAMLANHMWEEGWFCYDRNLVPRFQTGIPIYDLPLWDGTPGKVVIAGEQGLGDEIMFASMIRDMRKETEVIIDTDPRLVGLFNRSFHCETRTRAKDEIVPWKNEDATHWLPAGSMGAFYRTNPESFTGKPYLTADPERRIQWRGLLDSLSDKPKIGIAWSGGLPKTGEFHRSLSIEALAPILEYDVEWISLQYKNAHDVPSYMHHWPRAVESRDYDDTAALIAELDLVISVQTTVIHCAGALGKETLCLLSNRPQWRYGASGEEMPWYKSVKLLRQSDEGVWPLHIVMDRLEELGAEKIDRKDWDLPVVVGDRHVALAMAG